jgi:DedD protein
MFASRSSAPGKAPPPPPQSIEAVRRRARHRLIGAAVLVLLGVIGFPLLFDTEPRPMSIDIPIDIPAKTPKPALSSAPPAKESAKTAPAVVKPVEPSVSANQSLGAREEVVEPGPQKPAETPLAKSPDKAPEKTTAKAAEKSETTSAAVPAKSAPANVEADRARALLEGKPAAKPVVEKAAAATPVGGSERLVVQVGAFAEAAGAREVRSKLERAGLKTYTHVAKTPQGDRIRVRVGPFDSRAEADKAAARVKALGLPAAILTL